MPPVWPLEPAPITSDSNSATLFSAARVFNQAAAARPVNPPPTIAKSRVAGNVLRAGIKSTSQGRFPQFFPIVPVPHSVATPFYDETLAAERYTTTLRPGRLEVQVDGFREDLWILN